MVTEHPPRQVTLVLCGGDGGSADPQVLGVLPPYDVELPWWQDVTGVVAGARATHGVDVTVLRLLSTGSGWGTAGGPVTYLAETGVLSDSVRLRLRLSAWTHADPLVDEPLRLPYARPGGPAADLAWAMDALRDNGIAAIGAPEQVRTWNLSSIWRIPTDDGLVWLKVVPPFFAHEGPMLARLDPSAVPRLIAAEGTRVLLANAAGADHWGADLPVLARLVSMLVALQVQWADRVDELVEVGAPDWRPASFVPAAQHVLAASAGELSDDDESTLRTLVDELPARFAAVAECGLPDTLSHGDFHPGNAVGGDDTSVLLDWGDSGIGQPLLDQAAAMASISPELRAPLAAHWASLWRDAVPGCDPERAATLLEPISALHRAIVYRRFCDNIEPAERVYHSGDSALWLSRAAAHTRAETCTAVSSETSSDPTSSESSPGLRRHSAAPGTSAPRATTVEPRSAVQRSSSSSQRDRGATASDSPWSG